MKMFDKILNYFKSIFLYIIAILSIVLFVFQLRRRDKDEAQNLKDEEKERIRLAKEKEQRKLLEALVKFKEEKEIRDDKIEKTAQKEQQQLNDLVELNVIESVKDGSKLAKNIAKKFGAKYAKKSDE
jgi:hypothetical protein